MEYRDLGRTGQRVGAIGLGMEHLEQAPAQTTIAVVQEAIDAGVNWFDLFMATPAVRDAMGRAVSGRRDRVLIAGHLGPVVAANGQGDKTRDPVAAERSFEDLLHRLGTDYVDALFLFWVDEPEEYASVFGPGGLAEVAQRLQRQGKARYVGLSTHVAAPALEIVRDGALDFLMFPVNPAFDLLPAHQGLAAQWSAEAYQDLRQAGATVLAERRQLYAECVRTGTGVIAMKPFAGGWLFRPDHPSGITLTPVQCLSYALTQPAVCVALPGCRSSAELRASLAWAEATPAERDYSVIGANDLWQLEGACMYCNHCLPCPVGIDIGEVSRLADVLPPGGALPEAARRVLESGAACVSCGDCIARCPFGVDVIHTMERAAALAAA